MGADQNTDWHAELANALDWWREAGVDIALQDAPRDWLTAPAPQSRVAAVAAPAPAAALPATLEAFATWRTGADVPEAAWGLPLLPAEGPASATLTIVIEMPEREDAGEGRLLGGPCGRLFDRMLAAIGRDRASVHLVPLAAARPVSGRIPAADAAALADILRHYLGLLRPARLLLLGEAPARALLGTSMIEARGSLRPLNHDGAIKALTSFHPGSLIERPQLKAQAWKDLQMLIESPAA